MTDLKKTNPENVNAPASKLRSKKKLLIAVLIILAALLAFGAWFSGMVGGITKEEAKKIALKEIDGAKESEIVISDAEFDDMQKTYNVQITHDNILYSFDILARNGEVSEIEMQSMIPDADINKAMRIAADNVEGAKVSDVKSAQLEEYNGKVCYEIEISCDGKEYEIFIDPESEQIIGQSSESIAD